MQSGVECFYSDTVKPLYKKTIRKNYLSLLLAEVLRTLMAQGNDVIQGILYTCQW